MDAWWYAFNSRLRRRSPRSSKPEAVVLRVMVKTICASSTFGSFAAKSKILGFGSGRRLGDKAKRTTGSCPSLDVRRLCRERRLRPGLSFGYEWTRYGQKAAAIEMATEPNQVTLLYCYRRPTGELQRVRCLVQVERSKCHYGGQRVWFRCPREGCGRRVQFCMEMSPSHVAGVTDVLVEASKLRPSASDRSTDP
jgi:hypothetical protein